MNEEKMNIEIRKFLKKAGIGSQREIEKAVTAAIDSGNLRGDETLSVTMTLKIPELGLDKTTAGTIGLD